MTLLLLRVEYLYFLIALWSDSTILFWSRFFSLVLVAVSMFHYIFSCLLPFVCMVLQTGSIPFPVVDVWRYFVTYICVIYLKTISWTNVMPIVISWRLIFLFTYVSLICINNYFVSVLVLFFGTCLCLNIHTLSFQIKSFLLPVLQTRLISLPILYVWWYGVTYIFLIYL